MLTFVHRLPICNLKLKIPHFMLRNSPFSDRHILPHFWDVEMWRHRFQLESRILKWLSMYSEHVYKVGFRVETSVRISYCAIIRWNANICYHRGLINYFTVPHGSSLVETINQPKAMPMLVSSFSQNSPDFRPVFRVIASNTAYER